MGSSGWAGCNTENGRNLWFLISLLYASICNEWYLKDLSRKLRSAQRVKSSQGYALGQPPLGYMRDPENLKRWVVDEEGADIVRILHFADMFEDEFVKIVVDEHYRTMQAPAAAEPA